MNARAQDMAGLVGTIAEGRKTHDVRVNDRGYAINDLLILREWRLDTGEFTGRQLLRKVTYVTLGGTWGLPNELCVLSIQ